MWQPTLKVLQKSPLKIILVDNLRKVCENPSEITQIAIEISRNLHKIKYRSNCKFN